MSDLEEHQWVFYGRLTTAPSRAQCHGLIDGIVERIAMTPFGERIEHAEGEGRIVIQPIAESHIAVMVEREQMVVHVFSCKAFDVAAVIDELEGRFLGEWLCQRVRRAMTPSHFAEAKVTNHG